MENVKKVGFFKLGKAELEQKKNQRFNLYLALL